MGILERITAFHVNRDRRSEVETYEMEKVKVRILRQVSTNVSANVDGTEEYANNRLEEIYSQEEISVEEVISKGGNLFFCLIPKVNEGLCC